MIQAERRIARVLAALARLRARPAASLAPGLSPAGARAALDLAIRAITADGLRAELGTAGRRPRSVAVICAAGVFTAPLEWIVLFAAAGCKVFAKAPSAEPEFVAALVEDLAAERLPVELRRDRELPSSTEAVVAFGSDATMAEIARLWPASVHSLYGHRFSLAFLSWRAVARPDRLRLAASALARDLALYDSAGCMAPVAIFTDGPADVVVAALSEALAEVETVLPRGALAPAHGPALRARVMLARARGQVREGPAWAALSLPDTMFLPSALPRVAMVHPVAGPERLAEILGPWRGQLSTIGSDLVPAEGQLDADAPAFLRWAPRTCPLGAMQTPPFPRRHDGRPMLGSILLPRVRR